MKAKNVSILTLTAIIIAMAIAGVIYFNDYQRAGKPAECSNK